MLTALLAIGAGVITQLVLFAFTFGRVTKTLEDHTEKLNDHEWRLRGAGL